MSNIENDLQKSLRSFVVTDNDQYKMLERAIEIFDELQKQGLAQKRGNRMSVPAQSLTPQSNIIFNT